MVEGVADVGKRASVVGVRGPSRVEDERDSVM